MTNQEIKEQIDANNATLETLINPTQFTLNPIVSNLLHEIAQLQSQCTHSFKDGVCEYCYKKEIKG